MWTRLCAYIDIWPFFRLTLTIVTAKSTGDVAPIDIVAAVAGAAMKGDINDDRQNEYDEAKCDVSRPEHHNTDSSNFHRMQYSSHHQQRSNNRRHKPWCSSR